MNTDTKLSKCKVDEIAKICADFNKQPGELINILHKVQGHLGYLPQEVQEVIALQLNIPVSKVYGVVTFYTFFTMKPKGKYPISVCMGTACYVRGAEDVVDELKKELGIKVGEVTVDGKFSLDTLRCVGACGLAPVMMIGEKVFGHLEPKNIRAILDSFEE